MSREDLGLASAGQPLKGPRRLAAVGPWRKLDLSLCFLGVDQCDWVSPALEDVLAETLDSCVLSAGSAPFSASSGFMNMKGHPNPLPAQPQRGPRGMPVRSQGSLEDFVCIPPQPPAVLTNVGGAACVRACMCA